MVNSSCSLSGQERNNDDNDSINEIEVTTISLNDISIKGRWESKDNPLYPILEFKGKSTVMVGTILFPLATSYERDEEFIRINTDQSDLLFELVSQDTIVGSGFATGTWIRVE